MFRLLTNKKTLSESRCQIPALCILLAFSLLITSCTANQNPDEAGLFGSVYHMSKGTYKNRNKKKRQELQQLKQRQQQQQKQLQILDVQLRQQQNALARTEKSLQINKQLLRHQQQALQGTRNTYAAQGEHQSDLRKQASKLDSQIKAENVRIKKQAAHIRTLKTKRDALRKELALQSSL